MFNINAYLNDNATMSTLFIFTAWKYKQYKLVSLSAVKCQQLTVLHHFILL